MKRYCILKCLILICLLFCVAEGRAQFDARFSQYWVVKGYENILPSPEDLMSRI